MATMHVPLRRNQLNWVALVLSGMLVGTILALGITQLNQAKPAPSVPAVVAPPAQVSEPSAGRLGGIDSSDTANDWQVREALATGAAPVDRLHKNLVGGDQTLQDNEPVVGVGNGPVQVVPYLPGRDTTDPSYLPIKTLPGDDSSYDLPPLDEERQYRNSVGAPPAYDPRLSQPQ